MKLKFNTSLFAPSDIIIVAVSGGIDSMVLLSQLISIKERLNLELHVAHMNYHKRPTSNQNETFVESISKHYNLDFQSFDFDESLHENFQMVARDERYKKFYQYAKKVNASKIALAHHLDDQMETILMRLTRGSSFTGYSGMKETTAYKDVELVRPLLHESKENIFKYANEQQIDFQEDESNQSDDYTRNRFRHNVLPVLKEENPKVLEKMDQFSEYLSSAYELVLNQTMLFLNKYVSRSIDRYTIPISKFLQEVMIVQKEIIIKSVNAISHNQTELSEKTIHQILEMMTSKKPNIQKRISSLVFVYKEYDSLHIQSKEEEISSFEIILEDFGTVVLPSGDQITISQNPDINSGKSIDLWYNNLDSIFPIIVRNRKEKDALIYSYGTKKLKDLLIDKKIPMNLRNTLPLVIDSKKQIIYIPNIYHLDNKEHINKIYINYLKG